MTIRPLIAAALAMAGCLMLAPTAEAGQYSDAFSKCLTRNSSTGDRVVFAKWLFLVIAAHPDVAPLAKVSKAERDTINRDMANVANRLILTDCRKEAVATLKFEGGAGFEKGFEVFGEVAATELLGNPAVARSLENFPDYLDTEGWQALIKEANYDSRKSS